jgi:hypothetical protein
MRTLLLVVLLLCPLEIAGQEAIPADAYGDPRAESLVRLARARRAVVDTRITAYEVTAHERYSVKLVVAGFERLLFRRDVAAQIDWTPDTVRVNVMGAREAQPIARETVGLPPPDVAGMASTLAFDPVDSEMLFRVDSTVIVHPLAAGSEEHYRFSGGDSTTIRLADGREVRLHELRIAARRPEPRLINGSFWLDEATHAVVRAGFRLSRDYTGTDSGISVLRPEVGYAVDHVAIDYALWDRHWWLPRTVVASGVAHVGRTRFPISYERSYEGYTVEGDPLGIAGNISGADEPAERPCRPPRFGSIVVSTGGQSETARRDSAWAAAWDRAAARVAGTDSASIADGRECDRAFVVTRAEVADLVDSPAFRASVYDEDDGPVTSGERRALAGLLEAMPETPWVVAPPRLQLLTPDLVRFNRVEGLSLGAGATLPLGRLQLRAEVRAGSSGEIGARVGGVRAAPALRTELAAYRGMEAVDVAARPFSISSSVSALLLGVDESDYFRGTGAELRVSPPDTRPRAWDVRLFAERQEPVRAATDFSVRGLIDDGFTVRENLTAERLNQAGAVLRTRTATGDDPRALRMRGEIELHVETGDRSFARPVARVAADSPLFGPFAAGLGLMAGTGLGDVPAQRIWQVGGGGSVRGHAPASRRGESIWLARGELAWGTPLMRVSAFGDAGWAGASADLWSARPLRGVGVGIALLDNLLRVDLARGLGSGYRLHLGLGLWP